MTNKDKVLYLSQYIKISREYSIVFESYVEYKSKLSSIKAQVLSGMPSCDPVSKDKICDAIVILEGLQQKALAILEQLQVLRAQIINKINSIENNKSKSILTYRYINGYSWETICEVLNMKERTVFYLHRQGLDQVKI